MLIVPLFAWFGFESQQKRSLTKYFKAKFFLAPELVRAKKAQVLLMKHDYDFEEFRDYGLLLLMTIMQNTSAECGKTYTKNAVLTFFVLAESTQVK